MISEQERNDLTRLPTLTSRIEWPHTHANLLHLSHFLIILIISIQQFKPQAKSHCYQERLKSSTNTQAIISTQTSKNRPSLDSQFRIRKPNIFCQKPAAKKIFFSPIKFFTQSIINSPIHLKLTAQSISHFLFHKFNNYQMKRKQLDKQINGIKRDLIQQKEIQTN